MDSKTQKLKESPRGLAGRMVEGNDRSRALYTDFKRKLNGRRQARRQQLAGQCQPSSALHIPDKDGYRIFEPGTFEEIAEITQIAHDTVERSGAALTQTKKAQLKQGLLDTASLTLDSPQLRFALRPDIIESVSKYLGVVPVLADIDVWHSIFTGQTPSNSQLYHCDTNDITQVKIFIYSTDVTENDGPLVVIGADDSKMIRDKLGYTYEGKRKRVTDEQIADLIPDNKQHPIVGPPGTVAFVDSSRCFHYGSRVREGGKSRTLTIIQFFTPTAFVLPIDYREKAPYRHLDAPHLTEMQRLVLGVD